MPSRHQVVTPLTVSTDADRAARPVTDSARPMTRADAPCAWRAAALAAYVQEIGVDGARLRTELATRVSTLTGCALAERTIITDPAACWASAAMDGEVFQLQGHRLIVLRPCAYCGTGRFASPPIETRGDLGYAVAAWMPYHPDCTPTDPPDDVSW